MRLLTTISVAVLLLVLASGAAADDAETFAMRRVRLTTDRAGAQGCARLGVVRDDAVKDLRKKIVRAGGNVGVLTFGLEDLSMIYADVFRCTQARPAAPAAPLAPGVPPPPPGVPPPPPPGAVR